jgi:hypothetical protein
MSRKSYPYIHKFIDRNGKRRHYFRRPGYARIALPGPYGSPAFDAAYAKALAGMPAEIGATNTEPGTVNEAIVAYYKSIRFRELATTTQYMRRLMLEKFREQFGQRRLATMPQTFLIQMMDRMPANAARSWIKTIRQLMQHAASIGLCKIDPTQNIRLPKIRTQGIHTWTEREIVQYETFHAVGTPARMAFALPLFTAQRRAESCAWAVSISVTGCWSSASRKPESCWKSQSIGICRRLSMRRQRRN